MSHASLKLGNPPVIEAVVGVQFAPFPAWTNGHLGWFWKQYLGEEWVNAADVGALGDQFERFGDEQDWQVMPNLQVRVTAAPATRLQITNAAGDRMVQIQPTRFLYNWQKRDSVYPSYNVMRSEFDQLFESFRKFVADAKLGEPILNQWEITYVDHVPRGELWSTPADWCKVFSGLLPSKASLGGSPLESVDGERHYVIKPARGRIHVALQYGRTIDTNSDVLVVQCTARGPIRQEPGWGLDDGLEIGHNAVIAAFKEMASPEAFQAWEIEEG